MKVTMNDSCLTNVSQLKQVLKGSEKLDLSLRTASIADKYQFIGRTIKRLSYSKLSKKEKRAFNPYGWKGIRWPQYYMNTSTRHVISKNI